MQSTRGNAGPATSAPPARRASAEAPASRLPEYLYQLAILLAVLMILWTVAA